MSRVFVVQLTIKADQRTGQLKPKHDISSAEEYGELYHLLSPTASPHSHASVVAELSEKLSDYSDDDYLLLIGSPALIGFAVAIAADYNEGRVNLLQWSGRDGGRYVPIRRVQVLETEET